MDGKGGEATGQGGQAKAELSPEISAWRAAVAARGEEPAPAPPAGPVTLAVVVPCYNEQEVMPETVERLAALRAQLLAEGLVTEGSTVELVDDGSSDGTWRLIEAAAGIFPWLHGIRLSRNRGHQHALLAGMLTAAGDAVVTVDADLQDDLQAIREMLLRHARGEEIVYGVRASRESDTVFKRGTAELYYRLLRWCGVDVVFNHADYRLLGRRALRALADYGEVNLFLRGLIPLLGFQSGVVTYDRRERYAGTSKYPLRRMLALAWDGITSFSSVPLRWITLLGTLVSLLSFVLAGWALVLRLLWPGGVVLGWASTVVPLVFLGGVQLLGIGVIGEYVGKVYLEVKHRPRFLIDRRI
ncbi:MAG TPA: glycosyltransferase family 2 protein [Anaeromyxobacter sp.]|nr:glycosyltransferase family 2 protein [Anaeromyxobacter sp.]